jgi:hypothetical protein
VAGGVALASGTLVLAAVTAAGPTAPAGPTGSAPATGPGAPVLPDAPPVLADCWVPAATGSVSLTLDEAKALTTLAAGDVRKARRPPRIRAAVDRMLDLTAGESAALTDTLLGARGSERLTCSPARLDVEPETAGRNGLTPRARRLRAAWTEVFGPLPAGGFARGGISSGHVDSSSHYDGRALDVFFRPYDDAGQRRAGLVFAQWLVAHAQDHGILSIIYADRIWTSWAAFAGWRDYVHPSGNTTNPVLRHLDHVHVAVESGRPYRRP